MEIWKIITDYPNYEISNIGRVRNMQGRILKQDTRLNTGYKYVLLTNGTKKYHANIQRLVARAFIDNPNHYPVVNHINEDKTDNRVENLEWCTHSINSRKSKKNKQRYKAVLKCDKNDNIIARYDSIHEAAESMGKRSCATNICACLRGRIPTYKKFKWRYENEGTKNQ